MSTFVKRPPTSPTFLPQSRRSFQLSPYQSPTSWRDKGKALEKIGYVAHIGNPEISKNKKLYCNVKLQVTKTEYTTIRFMVKGGCPNAEKLRLIKKEEEEKGILVIVLQKGFKSDDAKLFKIELASKYIFQNNSITFQPFPLATSIKEIKNHNTRCFHVSASDVKHVSSNLKCRNGILIHESGKIMVTMWEKFTMCERRCMVYCHWYES